MPIPTVEAERVTLEMLVINPEALGKPSDMPGHPLRGLDREVRGFQDRETQVHAVVSAAATRQFRDRQAVPNRGLRGFTA